jgi:hypothetical protein
LRVFENRIMGAILKFKDGKLDGDTVNCITRGVFAKYFSDFRLKEGELEGSCDSLRFVSPCITVQFK